jgi:HNH endonuclease
LSLTVDTLLFVTSTSQAAPQKSFPGITSKGELSGSQSSLLGESEIAQLSKSSPFPVVASPALLITGSTQRTDTGRRRYYAPETLSQSDGSKITRVCLTCGKVRRSTDGVTCLDCYMAARASTWLTLPCTRCGTEFQIMRAEHEKKLRRGQANRYCSLDCVWASLRSPGRPCRKCGKPTGSIDPGRRYCSTECRLAAKPPAKTKPCPQCSVVFSYSSKRRVYCTKVCADAAHSTRMVSTGNSHYKTGTSYATWFRLMRPLVAERDQHVCRACLQPDKPYPVTRLGRTAMRTSLLVHHIDERPWNNRPENLILICWSCHLVHHKSAKTPFPWFATYTANATMSMTSRWLEITTSLQKKYSPTTV